MGLGLIRPLCTFCALLGLLGLAGGLQAEPATSTAVRTLTAPDLPAEASTPATHRLALTLYLFPELAWDPEAAVSAARAAAALLAQCGVRTEKIELRSVAGGEPAWRDLRTPGSDQLAGELDVQRPAVFFVRDTRRRPAFEAEAFGTGNTRTRPALAGTVWITLQARDLPLVVAHELAHVLMDSGEHSEEPGNLMRDETAPENTRLTPAQCARMRERGTANRWLAPR